MGGNRLIDIPISNCLHAGLKRIFVLTQFNSASLNRHVAQTYRLDLFSDGFVEVLAAEQTPERLELVPGHGRRRPPGGAALHRLRRDYFLDPRWRPPVSDGLLRAHRVAHRGTRRHHDRRTAGDARRRYRDGHFPFDDQGQIIAFEEKPNDARLAEIGSSMPRFSTTGGASPEKPFVASMGIYVFSRDVLLEILDQPGVDFGKEILPKALGTHRVTPYVFRGYWADLGTIDAFYDANIQLTRRGAPFNFFHPRWPIYTHPRFLPATRAYASSLQSSIVAEGCYLDQCTISDSVVGIRTRVGPGAQISRSVLLGADSYEEETSASAIPLGIGRETVLDRVIVDKNARIGDGVRLVNAAGVDHADGSGIASATVS
jgi:glucose-1-phosphate adenylyltransferase